MSSDVDSTYTGYKLIQFTAAWIPVQIIFVALRFYVSWTRQNKLKITGSDVLMVSVLTGQMALAAIALNSVWHAGVGYHVEYLETIDPNILVTWGKYLVAIAIIYAATVNLPKLVILNLYYQLFDPKTFIRICVPIFGVALILSTLATSIAVLAACQPFEANWYPTMPGAKCIDKEALFRYASVPNILSDILLLILPIPVVWNLQVGTRFKLGLTATFAVGSFGLVTSIIRFATFYRTNSFTDGTWSAVDLVIWTQIETGVYLICACLPTLRPLIEKVGKKSFISTKSRSGADASLGVDTGRKGSIVPLESKHERKFSVARATTRTSNGFEMLDGESLSQISLNKGGDDILVTTDFTMDEYERRVSGVSSHHRVIPGSGSV